MANVSFSLTEQYIRNPVLQMRAADPESLPGMRQKALRFAKTELATRAAAIFTSVFAAADTCVHLYSGIHKGGHIFLRKYVKISPAPYSKDEVRNHFRLAGLYAVVTLIGSVAGAILPQALKHIQRPLAKATDEEKSLDVSDIPETLRKASKAVERGELLAPFTSLQKVWEESSLSGKRRFVETFNQDRPNFSNVRKELAKHIYHQIKGERSDVQWLSPKEIQEKNCRSYDHVKNLGKAFFFHATSIESLDGILKSQKIEVRHEKFYRGAFVSTKPDHGFGNCFLAFRRNIERLSPLTHGFTVDSKIYWAGFAENIPVNEMTLAYVALKGRDQKLMGCLHDRLKTITGREIDVISLDDVRLRQKFSKDLQLGIPAEWPEEKAEIGSKILETMKAKPEESTTPQPSPKKQESRVSKLVGALNRK